MPNIQLILGLDSICSTWYIVLIVKFSTEPSEADVYLSWWQQDSLDNPYPQFIEKNLNSNQHYLVDISAFAMTIVTDKVTVPDGSDFTFVCKKT